MKKIVIRVCMPCDKCRSKALEVVAKADGLISVAITGDNMEKLVEVVGDGIDPVGLASCLRKKVGYAEILLVEEVKKDKKPEEAKKKPAEEPEQPAVVVHPPPHCCPGYYCYCCPPPPPSMMVCECEQPNNCVIM